MGDLSQREDEIPEIFDSEWRQKKPSNFDGMKTESEQFFTKSWTATFGKTVLPTGHSTKKLTNIHPKLAGSKSRIWHWFASAGKKIPC